MKKVCLSLVAVALFGTMALSSCKSGNTEGTDTTTAAPAVEAPAPAPVDTAAAAATTDTAAVVK